MATVTVKATRKDGRVAFFERHQDHPNGEVFIRGDGKAIEVGDTHALKAAIRQGRVEVVQAQPVTRTQTPPTKTQGGEKQPSGEKPAPWVGYDEATVDDVVARLPELDDAGRARVLEYEKANKKRVGVMETLVNWNS